ncbi:hypothetical protein K504DRAFT_499022 [Pleomassaria siparia CBS 279.74]|uniref:Uncharacterized protein n=1 Tax=Pleomassaria siparia CBS 279.74 TaxID=1314801 RepID=A0A6G1KN42_9PLEO|nr:hypothetical protein K504DRAFT_499022 [Pleomassaria siparia CBS 279.74]
MSAQALNEQTPLPPRQQNTQSPTHQQSPEHTTDKHPRNNDLPLYKTNLQLYTPTMATSTQTTSSTDTTAVCRPRRDSTDDDDVLQLMMRTLAEIVESIDEVLATCKHKENGKTKCACCWDGSKESKPHSRKTMARETRKSWASGSASV